LFNSHVRCIDLQSSSRRVHQATTHLTNMTRQYSRDIYLLKHMLFLFLDEHQEISARFKWNHCHLGVCNRKNAARD